MIIPIYYQIHLIYLKAWFNIEDYMSFLYSKNTIPFINKISNGSNKKDDKEKNKKVKAAVNYSHKSKKWVLIEELSDIQTSNNTNKNFNIYWKEYEDDNFYKIIQN